jgi:ferrous iron transport protein B
VIGPLLGTQAAAMLGLYALGFLAAFVTAHLLKSSILRSEGNTFMLEMPPYRWPTLRSLGLRLLERAKIFLRRAGTVILAVSIILWVMAVLPLENGKPPAIEHSLIGTVGRTIEPLIEPLGFNWKIGIGLITSLAAREVIVGTLGTIYGMEDGTSQSVELQEALRRDLTPSAAIALLVFFAFAMQCFSTIAVVRRETGGWKWPAIQFGYMTALAYLSGLIAHRIFGSLLA